MAAPHNQKQENEKASEPGQAKALLIGGVLGAEALNRNRGLLDGRETVYHGTSKEAAGKIRQEGTKGKYTAIGSPEAKSITQVLPPDMVEKSKGLSFLTTNRGVAAMYASQHGKEGARRVNSNPLDHLKALMSGNGIVEARLPAGEYKAVVNPEFDMPKSEFISKQMGNGIHFDPVGARKNLGLLYDQSTKFDRVVKGDIDPKHIKGDKYKGANIKEVINYIKARPGKAALGYGLAGLSAGGIGYGASKLIGASRTDAKEA